MFHFDINMYAKFEIRTDSGLVLTNDLQIKVRRELNKLETL